VQVTLLLEGDIFGIGGNTPEWQTELYACQQLEATGHGACWFMIHDKDNNIYNRYNFIHAKLVIVDRRWVVVVRRTSPRVAYPPTIRRMEASARGAR
jgi:phosphatidylserine/phosphatidylglycerophosphate/cardiolipin synthase-like enzyme